MESAVSPSQRWSSCLLTFRMMIIYRMNLMFYSLWPEICEWAHKLIREVFEATERWATVQFLWSINRKLFCKHTSRPLLDNKTNTGLRHFWLASLFKSKATPIVYTVYVATEFTWYLLTVYKPHHTAFSFLNSYMQVCTVGIGFGHNQHWLPRSSITL